jgi:hypothetical protein
MKRKFDDMDLGGIPTGPVQTMSYERSRPQTPATTPGPMANATLPSMPAPSPHQTRHGTDTFMGNATSRSGTRPPTPFNPSLSVPATPPDLYLVTRSSPPISQSLWENFQPNQLFPDDSGVSYLSPPPPQQPAIDPSLQNQQYSQAPTTMEGLQAGLAAQAQHNQGHWPNQFEIPTDLGSSPEDTWSNSSKGAVPTTLNVEDW